MKIYKVGGCVRDVLLNVIPKDIDYEVVGATVDEMLNLGYSQVGKDFPVFIHPETNDEYALARKEISTGKKHTDFVFDFSPTVSLEESSLRRDFTINAMAMDDTQIYDYHNGQKDLADRCIRHVNAETFVQDPLRLLRGARFAAQLKFTIAPETMTLFKQMVKSGDLLHLTPERVYKETYKALSEGYDSVAYFQVLKECGALEQLFPELAELIATPEKLQWHPSGNTFAHTMIALDRVKGYGQRVKFMVLFHDLGKAKTPKDILPAHHGHDMRGIRIVEEIRKRLHIPNEYARACKMFCQYHMRLSRFMEMTLKKRYDMIKDMTRFNDEALLKDILIAFTADWTGEDIFNDITECLKIRDHILKIFYTMQGVNLESLSPQTQETLMKYKGNEFYTHYRSAMVSYLKNALDN